MAILTISIDSVINRLRILRLAKWRLAARICDKAVLERVIPSGRMVEATHKQEKLVKAMDTTWISGSRQTPMTSG